MGAAASVDVTYDAYPKELLEKAMETMKGLHAGPSHLAALRSIIASIKTHFHYEFRPNISELVKQLTGLTAETSMKYLEYICDLASAYWDEARNVPSDQEESVRKKAIFDIVMNKAESLEIRPSDWTIARTKSNNELPPLSLPQEVLDQLNRIYHMTPAEVKELPCFDTMIMFLLVFFGYYDQFAGLSREDYSALYDGIRGSNRSSDDSIISIIVAFLKKIYKDAGYVPQSTGPYTVSLGFVCQFLEDHSDMIKDDTTTAEVVSKIIVPETIETKQTYVDAKLRGQYPQYVNDCGDKKYFQSVGPQMMGYEGNYVIHSEPKYSCFNKPFTGEVYFLSHAWLMPFRKLVNIAISCLRMLNTDLNYIPHVQHYQDTTYLWIDIFCKNQHVPAPAMDEFETAMKNTKSVIFCLWPMNDPERLPVTLTRIWCLFEVWTCLKLGIALDISCDDGELPGKIELDVDVRQATATFDRDVKEILGLMESTLGIEEVNKRILDGIIKGIKYQKLSLHPCDCFDGDGMVLMADGTYKLVRYIRAGDRVRTHRAGAAKQRRSSANEGDSVDESECTAEVVLVAIIEVDAAEGVEVCEYKGLLITPEHPILVSTEEIISHKRNGVKNDFDNAKEDQNEKEDMKDMSVGMVWVQPKDFLSVHRIRSLNRVYNFELDRGHSVLINDVVLLTLGDDLGVSLSEENGSLYSGVGWQENPKRKMYMEAQTQRMLLEEKRKD